MHRVIYIASYSQGNPVEANHNSRAFNILIDSNIKLINEDYCEDTITGFGLFYTGYFINIVEVSKSNTFHLLFYCVSNLYFEVLCMILFIFFSCFEGPEETLIKHLKSLINTIDQNFERNSTVTRMKVLLVSHHINKVF